MLDILEFIFQDFWHWLGSFLLLGVIGSTLIEIFNKEKE